MEWKKMELRDENGIGLDLIQHEELIMFVNFQQTEPEKRLKMVRELKYKKGDILLCSYPKTGTHWLSNLVNSLIFTGPVDSMKTLPLKLLDLRPLDRWEEIENNPVRSTHFMINRLPIQHLEQGGKIIIITRDPRDAMVSYKYHAQHFEMINGPNISWNYFIDIWISGKLPFGSYFDYYNSWEKALKENKKLNVLIVHYEHLKTNGLKELQRIQEFLEVNNSEERLKHILDRYTIKKMKTDVDTGKVETILKDENGKSFIYRKGIANLDKAREVNVRKQEVRRDVRKYQQREIGDWKNHFTVAQSEYFDQVLEERFKDSIFIL